MNLAVEETPVFPEIEPSATDPDFFSEEEPIVNRSDFFSRPEPDTDDRPSPTPRSEAAAVLHAKATPRPPRPKKEINPENMVALNLRLPKFLKDTFFKTCQEQGTYPSGILRNLIRQYCGLCLALILAILLSPAPAAAQTQERADTTKYTTEQVMTYLQNKAFGGFARNVPNVRGSIGARHALWQGGAQKVVNVLENQLAVVRARRDYMNTQVNLRLANRSDLFGIEDNMFSLQARLFEAQSVLEQRVIELSMLAENNWLEAYNMIIKWDGILFATAVRGHR
jgi:hypothetical protein